jgi:hypothetical protein
MLFVELQELWILMLLESLLLALFSQSVVSYEKNKNLRIRSGKLGRKRKPNTSDLLIKISLSTHRRGMNLHVLGRVILTLMMCMPRVRLEVQKLMDFD